MSTTFYVYPCSDRIPSVGELLALANQELNGFLRRYGIPREAELIAGLVGAEKQLLPLGPHAPMWWDRSQYAWFSVKGVIGGTDAYARTSDELDQDVLLGDVATGRRSGFADKAQRAARVGRHWYFRRSAGQPPIINLAYGLLAASLAHLTDGFLDSTDGAWDPRLLPALPHEFLGWYFRPELTENAENKQWAERCIWDIVRESTPESA